jgi:hypothetical protein
MATTTGELVSGATGTRSFSGSKGMSFTVNGLMATLPGALFATASPASTPPAPPRFSTTTRWPKARSK